MRRIVAEYTAVDTHGNAWEFQVTVPWVDRPTDSVSYGEDASTGPETPIIIMNTPNDPEHWAYGEDGPRFDLAELQSLVGKANRAYVRAQHIDGKLPDNIRYVEADPDGA